MWNKICPHSRSEYFTAEQFHFVQQNFTCPMGKFRWKNDMLKSQRKACVVKYPLSRMWNYGKSHSEILRKTQCEIKFAHIREANTSLRSNFTLRSKISLAKWANFTEKIRLQKQSDFFWWGRTDSNHRSETQQIYSLSPLATRELPHILLRSVEQNSRIITRNLKLSRTFLIFSKKLPV